MEDLESRMNWHLPEGWTYDTYATPLAMFNWMICEHVAIGDIERGNVSFLSEVNYGPELPEHCAEAMGRPPEMTVELVTAIWVSDPDVKEALYDQLGDRIALYSLDYTESLGGPNPTARISWTIDGVQTADLHLQGTPGDFDTATLPYLVLGWKHGDGVGFWHMTIDDVEHAGQITAATGTVTDPHHNPSGTENWNGGASSRISNIEVQHYSFEDTLCEAGYS